MSEERNVVEQRCAAVIAVIQDGRHVSEVARLYSVARQTVHEWVRRYEAGGMAGLIDLSSK